MSSNITSPSNTNTGVAGKANNASPAGKGKGKGKAVQEPTAEEDDAEEEEEEEDDDDDEEMEEDDDDEEDAEEEFDEIDPSAIIGGRRTRGVKVDYTSKEALAKAGLTNDGEAEETDEDVEMK